MVYLSVIKLSFYRRLLDMEVIVISNKKGGTGKTTCALNLCAGLALKGYRVLGIDLDSQANFTKDSGTTPGEVMGAFDFIQDATLEDVLESNDMYDYICADKRLETQKAIFEAKGSDFMLRMAIKEKITGYDYVVIDTPPQMDGITFLAFVAADKIIVPADSDPRSKDGFADLVATVSSVKQCYNPGLTISGVLMTMTNPRTQADKIVIELFEDAAAQAQTIVFNTKIRYRTVFHQCSLMHNNVFQFDKSSEGAKEYMAFIDEFLSAK